MTTVPTRCPNCRAEYRVAKDNVGRWARCNSCGLPFKVQSATPKPDDGLASESAAPARTPSGERSTDVTARPAPTRPAQSSAPPPEGKKPEDKPVRRGGRLTAGNRPGSGWFWVGGGLIFGLLFLAGCGAIILQVVLRALDSSAPGKVKPAAAVAPAVEVNRQPKASTLAPVSSAAKGLEQLKAATVFVNVDAGPQLQGSGSGFVVRCEGNTAYIVTNDHVASPEPDAPSGSRRGDIPRAAITVVFRSGTKQEQAARAEVLASDPEQDLAVLRVSNVRGLPRPIDVAGPAELQETLPVTVYGFPFGSALATNRGNPAITVNKGSVSSIRRDERDRVVAVQIDGALNPGNSGGPVVDDEGKLVGVAVATIRATHIGLAVPGAEVTRILEGRAGNPGVRTKALSDATAELEVEVPVFDPLQRLRLVSVHYVPSAAAADNAVPGSDAEWKELAGSRRVDLQLHGLKAVGTIMVSAAEKNQSISFQTSWTDSAGRCLFNQPIALHPPPPGAPTVVRIVRLQQQMTSPPPGRPTRPPLTRQPGVRPPGPPSNFPR